MSDMLPKTCGECPKMGGTMCLDKRVPWPLAAEADKRGAPPKWCPLRTKGAA